MKKAEEEKVIKDAEGFVLSYIRKELSTIGLSMITPIISIQLGHTPKWEGDDPRDAVVVSRDKRTGYVHLYIMTSLFHKEVIEKMFDIEIEDYVGHVIIDSKEKSDQLFPIVKDFENILKSRLEEESKKKKELFPEWNNL